MLLHDAVFLGGQPPRLGQDVLGDADLADVVQQRGLVDDLDMVGVQPIARASAVEYSATFCEWLKV